MTVFSDLAVGEYTPWIVDGIIVVIALLFALIKAKKGFYNSVMSLVVVIVAVIIGFVGSKFFTPVVSDFVWEKAEPAIERYVDEKVEALKNGEQDKIEELKEKWDELSSTIGDKIPLLDDLAALLGDNSAQSDDKSSMPDDKSLLSDAKISAAVEQFRDEAFEKIKVLCDSICHFVLFLLITLVAIVVLKLIQKLFGKATKLPVISSLNHIGGFVLGLVVITILMFAIVRAAGALKIDFFKELSKNTVILKWLVGGNVTDIFELFV